LVRAARGPVATGQAATAATAARRQAATAATAARRQAATAATAERRPAATAGAAAPVAPTAVLVGAPRIAALRPARPSALWCAAARALPFNMRAPATPIARPTPRRRRSVSRSPAPVHPAWGAHRVARRTATVRKARAAPAIITASRPPAPCPPTPAPPTSVAAPAAASARERSARPIRNAPAPASRGTATRLREPAARPSPEGGG
jgi:hypothetical protein